MDRETGNSKGQDAIDAANEADIDFALMRLQTATTQAARRKALADMERGVKARSPQQVERMEIARGLAAGAGSTPR